MPYGTLLCVSDKPLHGELKLPGQANRFYERAISEHMRIGIEACERVAARRARSSTAASCARSTSRRSAEAETPCGFVRYASSMNREHPMATTTTSKPATPRKPAAARKPAADKATPAKSTTTAKSKPTSKSKSSAKKSGGHWGKAAIVGGVAVAGAAAATAALLALRGSTPVDPDAVAKPGKKARKAD